MDERFDTPRTIGRRAPRQAATVAVFRSGQKLAYGVLSNVSVGGACVVTDSTLPPGTEVNLKVSFFQNPELVELGARVVWCRRESSSEKGFEGLQLHGVKFTPMSAVLKAKLHALLSSIDFVDVYQPKATEFEALQNSLTSEFNQLAIRMMEATGDEP